MKTILCLILTLTATTAYADTMRCKGGIISTGASDIEVIAKCGPPTSVNEYGNVEHRGHRSEDINRMEAWTYNFGPYEFMYKLIMKNGVVSRIESLEPGF